MTNKIKKFLYVLEHLIPDGRDEIPTFALYHPLLVLHHLGSKKRASNYNAALPHNLQPGGDSDIEYKQGTKMEWEAFLQRGRSMG